VSYPWLDRNHPDPHGEQLRKLAFVLKAFAEKAREYKGCRVGVFWDYPSLPQKSVGCSGDEDDRTKEEMARFKRALKGINTWYGHQKTHVLLVTTPLPDAHEYTNMQPYDGRGWCKAERLMSVIVKDTDALIDLSQLQGDESSYAKIIEKGKSNRDPPMAPDAFHAMLTSGVEDGTIKFTNKGDVDLVAHIYKTAFLDEMTAATKLFYIQLDWGDEQVATLSAALAFAHARGALPHLETLYLYNNQIGDAGLTSLSTALARGALPQLVDLHLSLNQISDAGLTSFSEALASGALPQLVKLWLTDNQIGNSGLTSLSEALASGALGHLTSLGLSGNQIGDAGLKSFSEVLASGALAKLQDIYVDDKHMTHPKLKQVCKRRNIEIH